MYTLHHAAEIRSIDQIEELNSVPREGEAGGDEAGQQVIETFEGDART